MYPVDVPARALTALDGALAGLVDGPKYVDLPNVQFQRLPADCWACCVAMLTGVDYATVFDVGLQFDDGTEGITFLHMLQLLRKLGAKVRYHHPEMRSAQNIGRATREKVAGQNAIHLVPSLNTRNLSQGMHYVYVHDGRIYDPTPHLPYACYNELETLAVVYFADS